MNITIVCLLGLLSFCSGQDDSSTVTPATSVEPTPSPATTPTAAEPTTFTSTPSATTEPTPSTATPSTTAELTPSTATSSNTPSTATSTTTAEPTTTSSPPVNTTERCIDEFDDDTMTGTRSKDDCKITCTGIVRYWFFSKPKREQMNMDDGVSCGRETGMVCHSGSCVRKSQLDSCMEDNDDRELKTMKVDIFNQCKYWCYFDDYPYSEQRNMPIDTKCQIWYNRKGNCKDGECHRRRRS